MLQTLRAYQAEASTNLESPAGLGGASDATSPVGKAGGFGQLVSSAIGQVNDLQMQARGMQDAYDRGEPIALTEVVMGMQKSSLAFEATLQVRNKVLKAYEDILNMPV
ncbi:MAG: Flagellar hook-basal body complex protein FliE [Pseudomonadota bacterium]